MPFTRTHVRVGLFAASLALGAVYWVTTHPATFRMPTTTAARSRTLREGGATSIVCTVVRADGTPAVADVAVVRATDPGASGAGRSAIASHGSVARAVSDSRGRLTFQHLGPGAYVVIARVAHDRENAGASLWAAADVTTSRASTSLAKLTLEPAASITGRVITLAFGATPLQPDRLLLVFVPADSAARAALLEGAPHARPDERGGFAVTDVPAGHYLAQVSTDDGWTIDGIAGGGQDWLDSPARVAPGVNVGDLSVTMTDRPGRIEGRIRDAGGRPAPGRLVFAFSADATRRLAARRSQAARADGTGRFSIEGLPGGEYLVSTDGDADPATWFTPPFFAKIAEFAARVVVRAGTTVTTDLAVR